MNKLKPCPWDRLCHLEIHVEDDEGNDHGRLGCEYEDDPWSGGPWYVLYHDGECAAGEFTFGRYATIEGLVSAWNTRHEPTCENNDPAEGRFDFECSKCFASYSMDTSQCGTEALTSGIRFCPSCGRRVSHG